MRRGTPGAHQTHVYRSYDTCVASVGPWWLRRRDMGRRVTLVGAQTALGRMKWGRPMCFWLLGRRGALQDGGDHWGACRQPQVTCPVAWTRLWAWWTCGGTSVTRPGWCMVAGQMAAVFTRFGRCRAGAQRWG